MTTTETPRTTRRVVSVPRLCVAAEPTARELAAVDLLRALRVAHGRLVEGLRYTPPEAQPHRRVAMHSVRTDIRRQVAIVRRARLDAVKAASEQIAAVTPDGRETLSNGWTGYPCGDCGTGYGECTEAVLSGAGPCCRRCRTVKTHDQDEPPTDR